MSLRAFIRVSVASTFLSLLPQLAFSQLNILSCSTNVSVTPTLRAEGYAEQTGDIVFICTGGTPTANGATVPTADIAIFFNSAVTSRIYPSGRSEAVLIIDEPGSGLPGSPSIQLPCAGVCSITGTGTGGTYAGSPGRPNIFNGSVFGNGVTFAEIPLDPPGGNGALILRVANVKVNAAAFGGGQVVPAVASISFSGHSGLGVQISNPTPTVGFAQSGLTMEGRSPDNSQAGVTTAITSCASPQRAGVIRFSEAFGTAFKTRTVAAFVDGNTSPAPVAQNIPGTIYNTESNFYNPSLTSPIADFSTVGLASFGTRLQANIWAPSGARVWVSLNDAIYSGGNPAAGNSARLVGRAKGPFAPVAATAVLDGVPVAEVPVVNGVASATWEVLATNPYKLDLLDFVVWVQTGGTGSGWFSGGFAPSPAPAEVGLYAAASTTQPEPRFYQAATSYGLFTTSACQNSTSTVLSPSSSTITAGGRVTLTASVTATGGTPTGSVTFLEGAIPMATVNLTNGAASIVAPVSAGSHSYSASYPGNGSYGKSTSAAITVIGMTPPQGVPDLRVSSSASPSFVGQNLVYTATIITGGAMATGTVTFSDGAQVLGTASVAGGQAVFATGFAVAGNHDMVATYSGDANYAGATVHFVQTVKP